MLRLAYLLYIAVFVCMFVYTQEKEDDFVSALDNYKKALDFLMSLLQGFNN